MTCDVSSASISVFFPNHARKHGSVHCIWACLSNCAVNSGIMGRGRGQNASRHFSPWNFCSPTRKNLSRKKGKKRENGEEKKKNLKGKRWIKWRWKGKRYENEHRIFFSLAFSLFDFLKPLKFVWGLPKWTVFTVTNHISCREKNRENWLSLLWKIFLWRPW